MASDPYLRLSDLSRFVHRELILLVVLSAVAAGVFLVTRSAATGIREQEEQDATAWFDRGRTRLALGQTGDAVTALRRAVVRRPDEWLYAKTLSDALVADGRRDAARRALLLWRERRPEDADVNTQLARLEVGDGNLAAAVEYYESALYGRWPTAASGLRFDLRRELINYQLQQGQSGPALPHVLALAANLPDEPTAHIQTARLFLAAGDVARGVDHFQRALRLEPGNVEAQAGLGESAFTLGDYELTLKSLRGLTDEPSRARVRMATAVLTNDPLRSRLSFAERERRLSSAADYASEQLAACRQRAPKTTPLRERTLDGLTDALSAFRSNLSPQSLRESSDVIERGLRLVLQTLESVAEQCSPLDERGNALVRVARSRGAAR